MRSEVLITINLHTTHLSFINEKNAPKGV